MIIFYHFQLYVIQGRYRGRIIPVAFALMKNRRAPCYKLVWETLRDKVQNLTGRVLSPSKIVTDYEVSKRNYNEPNVFYYQRIRMKKTKDFYAQI